MKFSRLVCPADSGCLRRYLALCVLRSVNSLDYAGGIMGAIYYRERRGAGGRIGWEDERGAVGVVVEGLS
jgi:hypothetical protein